MISKWNASSGQGAEAVFDRSLGALEARLRDWAPAFRAIADDVLAPFVERQFTSAGAEGGTPWQELVLRQRRGQARLRQGTMLQRTGRMAASFIAGAADHVEAISGTKLIWGSQVPYAIFHQTGAGKGFGQERVATGPGTGRGMVMRRILTLTEPMRGSMRDAMMARLAEIVASEA